MGDSLFTNSWSNASAQDAWTSRGSSWFTPAKGKKSTESFSTQSAPAPDLAMPPTLSGLTAPSYQSSYVRNFESADSPPVPNGFVTVTSPNWNSAIVTSSSDLPQRKTEKAAPLPAPQVAIEEEISSQSLFKTELCRSYQETGACRYGPKCQFAHGKDELRPVLRHPKYKTDPCRTYSQTGSCPYGNRCRFIHSAPDEAEANAINVPWAQNGPAAEDSLVSGMATLGLGDSKNKEETNQSSRTRQGKHQKKEKGKRLAFFARLSGDSNQS